MAVGAAMSSVWSRVNIQSLLMKDLLISMQINLRPLRPSFNMMPEAGPIFEFAVLASSSRGSATAMTKGKKASRRRPTLFRIRTSGW